MKMIIDTDPGVDDAIAIALAHALATVDLIGLTTVFGNTFVDQSSRNARYLCDLLGITIPVAAGASLPYGADSYVPSANVHGPEGFGAITKVPQIGQDASETAAQFLVRCAAEHKGELVICAIGPLTNIADAVALDPDFASNLGRLVIMGGAFECAGNITPRAEANIWHDPIAADAVFAAGFEIVMVGLNATMKTLLTPGQFTKLASQSPEVGGFLNKISGFYLDFYRSVGVTDGCPMHDALAVLACTDIDRFTLHRCGISIGQSGENTGATLADANRPAVSIAMDVQADWAVETMMQMIGNLD